MKIGVIYNAHHMRKLAEAKRGKPAHNRGSTHSPETKAKMSTYWAARRVVREQAVA